MRIIEDDVISDAELVDAAREGARWAMEALYRRYVDSVFALAAHLLGERELAWDAVHNAFISAFDKLGSLREQASFAAWLRAIVVRQTLVMQRRRRRERNLRWHDVQTVIEDTATAEQRVTFERCQRWLHSVREPDRSIYLLRVVEGFEHADIAALTGVSVATVKRKLSRVEAHMRRLTVEEGSRER